MTDDIMIIIYIIMLLFLLPFFQDSQGGLIIPQIPLFEVSPSPLQPNLHLHMSFMSYYPIIILL